MVSACLWIAIGGCGGDGVTPETEQVVDSIEMRPPQLYVDRLGLEVQTSATAYAEDGIFLSRLYSSAEYPERFSWSSSAPSVVSVDRQGSLTSGSWGTATVTASHQGGLTGAMWVSVRDAIRLAWSVPIGTGPTDAGIAIGADGTVYVASRTLLLALSPQGSVIWTLPMTPNVHSIPAIGEDGTLYLGSNVGGGLTAVGPDGTFRWMLSDVGNITGSPAVGPDGTIYVASKDHHVYAVDPQGEVQWAYQGTQAFSLSSPAVASDGTIYVGGGARDNHLHAINADGSPRWTFAAGDVIQSSPAIGVDGTIYFGSLDKRLYAVNPDGTERWSVPLGAPTFFGPSIGPDGTIYIAADGVSAIDPGGSVRWNSLPTKGTASTPILGADGTVYVGGRRAVYALDAQGRLKWEYPTGDIRGPPAIRLDGTIFAASNDSTVYAIAENGSTNGGYAASPWPQARRNRANTARVGG